MVAMKMFIWIFIFCTLAAKASTNESNIHSITACYSPDNCSFYNLNCSSGSIRIMKAEYRHKYNSGCNNGSCNNADSCCYFNESDCKENFSELHTLNLYKQCSGRKICERNRATISSSIYCNRTTDMEQYVYLAYKCISEADIIDLCDSPNRTVYSEVNIMSFKKTRQKNRSPCTCLVESSSTVHYQLVDIRLFTPTNNDNTDECAKDTLVIGKQSIQCESNRNKSFVYMGSNNYEGDLPVSVSGNTIQLVYDGNKEIAMVWISLNASKENFSIQCFFGTLTTTPIVTESSGKIETTFSKYSTNMGKHKDETSLPTIIGVVIAVLIVIAVVVAALIIFKWRQKKRKEDVTHISDLPKGLTNYMYGSPMEAGDSNAAVETSNYDIINDELVRASFLPGKNKKDTTRVPERAMKYGDVSVDDYDTIEFEMKCANKASSYATLPAVEGKIGDNTYSHVSDQLQSVTTARVTANEYSHCKVNSNGMPTNDDYSHVGNEGDCKKNPAANTKEENDSYNRIHFEDAQIPMTHDKAVILEKESEL